MAESEMATVGMGDALQLATRDNAFGGEGSWIWVLVLIILMGGWNRGGNDAVTEAGLCNAMNFNNLENAVGRLNDQQQNQTMVIGNAIANLGYENLRNFNDTQRGVEQVKFEAAQNTAAINANTTAQVQKVLDTLFQNKIDSLQAQVNQLEMQNALSGVVRYPTSYAYSAGQSPFCGGCCGQSF